MSQVFANAGVNQRQVLAVALADELFAWRGLRIEWCEIGLSAQKKLAIQLFVYTFSCVSRIDNLETRLQEYLERLKEQEEHY